MQISDFLLPAHVMIDVKADNKDRLLDRLSTEAAAEIGLSARDVAREIAKREELGSTGIGNGIALPHARLPGLKAPFSLFARLSRSIDYDAIDAKPVDIVVLLLLPEGAGERNGNALACIARALRERETLSKLRHAANREAVFDILAENQAHE